MLKFLWDFRYVIAFIIYVIISSIIKGKDWRDKKIHEYMLAAKQMSKDGFLKSGDEQEEWVIANLVVLFKKFKIPVTYEMIRPVVQKLYKIAMDKMDDGQFNNSLK